MNPILTRLMRERLPGAAELVRNVLARNLTGQTPPPAAVALGTFVRGSHTCEAGTRPYRLFVPERLARNPALVVMLHGCTQTAEDFAAGTRMNHLAAQAGLLVLYPEQVEAANRQRCWNWFLAADQGRAGGEAALVASMTRAVLRAHGADPGRVFAAGLSAGGAQAANLGAAFPELFAAVGVHSGLACGAAADLRGALAAMATGRPGHGRLATRAIVFHGDRDATVNPRNADFVAEQVDGAGATEVERGHAAGGLAFTRTIRRDAAGRPMLEQWLVHGLGHAWSGGSADGSYTAPAGPDASMAMLEFFLR